MSDSKNIKLYGMKDFLRDLKSQPTEENNNITIFRTEDVPDVIRNGDPFRNDSYVMVFILEGDIDITIDFNSYHLQSPAVFFGTPGQVYSSTDNVQEGFAIIFKEEFLTTGETQSWRATLPVFHRFHSRPYLALSDNILNVLLAQLRMLNHEYSSLKMYKYEAMKAYLKIIVITLSREYTRVYGRQHLEMNNHLLRLETLIDAQFRNLRSVQEYADQLFMTPQNLNRITRKLTGKSVSNLIHDKLLIEIKRHLLYTDSSSEEIAYNLNFHDNSYFTKYFKKATGFTPKEFREKHKIHLVRASR